IAIVGLICTFLSSIDSALAACDDQLDRCYEQAQHLSDLCLARCNANFPNNFDAWDSCADRCDSQSDSNFSACDTEYDLCQGTASRGQGNEPFGSRQSGGDGCYFGECPEDFEQGPAAPSPQPPVPQQQT